MKHLILFFIFLIFTLNGTAQNKDTLPYYEVPDYYENYTAGTVVARMVDGLGFRYRWATEGLRPEDLNFRTGEGARTSQQTIDHILNLSRIIVNSTLKIPTDFSKKQLLLTFEQKRKETLLNFKKASTILSVAKNLEAFKIKFVYANGTGEYPFWNQINGPIADALWHTGQVVTLRRASGNPISSKVGFLEGRIKK